MCRRGGVFPHSHGSCHRWACPCSQRHISCSELRSCSSTSRRIWCSAVLLFCTVFQCDVFHTLTCRRRGLEALTRVEPLTALSTSKRSCLDPFCFLDTGRSVHYCSSALRLLTKRTRVRTVYCRVKPWAMLSFYIAPVHSAVWLITFSDGYLCTNCLSALIAAWLDAFQSSRGDVRLNRSARE